MSAFLRTLTGKNKTGQIIYGALDIAPIPPIHNLIRLAFQEKVPVPQIPVFVWQKLDKLRLTTSGIALFGSVAVVKGWISLEMLKEILAILSHIL